MKKQTKHVQMSELLVPPSLRKMLNEMQELCNSAPTTLHTLVALLAMLEGWFVMDTQSNPFPLPPVMRALRKALREAHGMIPTSIDLINIREQEEAKRTQKEFVQ